MKKRSTKKIYKLKLKPFTRYGEPIPKLMWYPINYNKKNGSGSYILKFKAGGKSIKHKHYILMLNTTNNIYLFILEIITKPKVHDETQML